MQGFMILGIIGTEKDTLVQSNLYKSATFGSGLNWLLYTGVCLIKVESEMSKWQKSFVF